MVVPTPTRDFIDQCLADIKALLIEQGWCRTYAHWQVRPDTNDALDLGAAIELIAELYAPYAADLGYPGLDTTSVLAAEIKALLCTLTPTKSYAPHAHYDVNGFNDAHDVHAEEIFQLLDVALEYYRPQQRGYRHRHVRADFPSYDIFALDPSARTPVES